MKVALVMWNMIDLGGILTYQSLLFKGFRSLGIDVNNFWISSVLKLRPKQKIPTEALKFGLDATMPVLGFEDSDDLSHTLKILNQFDLIVFLHFGMRKAKRYKSENWMKVYKGLKHPMVFVLYHDPFWDKPNCKWVLEIVDKIDLAITMHHSGLYSLENFPKPSALIGFPMEIEGIAPNITEKKGNLAVQFNMFKAWKHNDVLIKASPEILTKNNKLKIEIYGTGIQYHYGKKESWWAKAVECDRFSFKGRVPYEKVIKVLHKADFLINMAEGTYSPRLDRRTQGHPDYVTLEAMAYGVIPIIRQEAFSPELFTEDQFIMLPYTGYGRRGDKKRLKHLLTDSLTKEMDYKKLTRIRRKNVYWIRNNYGYDIVAKQIIRLWRQLATGKAATIQKNTAAELKRSRILRGL